MKGPAHNLFIAGKHIWQWSRFIQQVYGFIMGHESKDLVSNEQYLISDLTICSEKIPFRRKKGNMSQKIMYHISKDMNQRHKKTGAKTPVQ